MMDELELVIREIHIYLPKRCNKFTVAGSSSRSIAQAYDALQSGLCAIGFPVTVTENMDLSSELCSNDSLDKES